MKRKWLKALSILITITNFPTLISCQSNSAKTQTLKNQYIKLNSPTLNNKISTLITLDDNINKIPDILQKQEGIFNDISSSKKRNKIFKKTKLKKSNKQEIIKKRDEELLLQLEEIEKKNKYQEKSNKLISLGLSITSSIAAGVAAGLGAYFGLKDIKSSKNVNKNQISKEVEEIKDLSKAINLQDPLIDIFSKLIKLSFNKQFPKAIFEFLKQTIFKDVLQDFDKENEDILINKLKLIEEPSKIIIENFHNTLLKINLNKEDYIQSITKEIKEQVVTLVKNQFPQILKGILEFGATKSNASAKGSIFGRIIQSILKNYKINLENIDALSSIIDTYVSLLSNANNEFISFLVTKLSEIIKNKDFTYNILDDLFDIINLTLSSLLANDINSNELSLEKLFNDILPKIINIITIDKTKTYDDFVNFINSVFEENNKKKWVYEFLNNKSVIPNESVYLSNNPVKQKHSILLPKINLTFENIFQALKKIKNINDFIKKIMNFLFEPLIIQLTKSQMAQNAKKAIFRLSGLLTFIYYNYVKPTSSSFINSIINTLNPYEPDTFIVKIIEDLLKIHNINNITIDSIFGESHNKYLLLGKRYNFFSEIKELVNKKDQKIIQKLKSGNIIK